MNLFLLTQPDAFYIPKLLDQFMREKPEEAKVVGASVLKGEIAAANVVNYARLLGVRGFLINGFEFTRYKVLDWVDRTVGLVPLYSVHGALQQHNVPEYTPESINDESFHAKLREWEVDLIVSVACPQIVRKELLSLPPKGVINIHGAMLPKYRGKLPSFWVLANGEKTTGVTVHYMNEELDDGPIILQKEVPIAPSDTLHSLVLKSKVGYGASALAEAVRQIQKGTVTLKENDASKATYFSFPTPDAIRRFRQRGRKIR